VSRWSRLLDELGDRAVLHLMGENDDDPVERTLWVMANLSHARELAWARELMRVAPWRALDLVLSINGWDEP